MDRDIRSEYIEDLILRFSAPNPLDLVLLAPCPVTSNSIGTTVLMLLISVVVLVATWDGN